MIVFQHESSCTHQENDAIPESSAPQVVPEQGLEGFLREVAAVAKQVSQIITQTDDKKEEDEKETVAEIPEMPKVPTHQP